MNPGRGLPDEPVLGVDLGATHLRVARLEDGAVVERRQLPSAGPAHEVLEALGQLLQEVGESRVGSLGIAVAGFIDWSSGRVRQAPNLGWRDVPLVADLRPWFAGHIRLVNDVSAAAYGESRVRLEGGDHLVALFFGTGLGGGIVDGGHLLEGRRGAAGELGHLQWQADGPPCPCGQRGCFEAFLGGRAVVSRWRQHHRELPIGATVSTLAEAASRGRLAAEPIWDEMLEAACGLGGQVVAAFDPELVVVGGGVAAALPAIREAVRRGVTERACSMSTDVRVEPARLGDDAGLVGAALLAHREAQTQQPG